MNEPVQSERQTMSIVALGSFNPAIFHPVWFAQSGLIRAPEADESDVKVVSPQVTVVQSEWFNLQVTTDRFSVETRDPRKFLPLRDLVSATFEILEHTPLNAFGFNSHQSFQLDSAEAWHHFGDHFAPKNSWSDLLDEPGLLNLTIQGMRTDSSADRIQIKIQPASDIKNGVVIGINEHYKIPDPPDDEPPSAEALVQTLALGWNAFQDYSKRVAAHLLNEGRLPE